ncbi:MAG TPA: DUF5406 family protein [Caproiciproducens sp.]|nr:DUF5406 family protein [Caproiciproducens sp.]
MKFYDNRDNFRERIHTIKVTFQTEDYVGHIEYEMGGNCQGLYLLDYDPDCVGQDDIETYTSNDCQLSFDEDTEMFRIVLKNPAGEELECERDAEELKDLIVSIEIVNCKLDETSNLKEG